MTVFEQMVSLKEQRIEKLEKELVKIYDSSPEGSTTESLEEEYKDLYSLRDRLKVEVFKADYSQEETEEAQQRLNKIKQIEERTGNAAEDTVSQMKDIWKQLAQALLLQKDKIQGGPMITFLNTPSASKEPIARVARFECSKLNRLAIKEGEPLRAFSARCRAEELYCSWLRTLHAPLRSLDRTIPCSERHHISST
jgi:hypothetical protein